LKKCYQNKANKRTSRRLSSFPKL